jgi:competence protein ComEA
MKPSFRWISTLVALALAVSAVPATAAEPQTAKVNVNTASATQLALLPRVGPAVAARIVEYREANGAFKTLEDLMLVRGIGEKTFDLLAPYVALAGDTTLKEKVRLPRPAEAASEKSEP